jgi:RHS repeat-associated protein
MTQKLLSGVLVFVTGLVGVSPARAQPGPEPGTESGPSANPAGSACSPRTDSTRSVVSNAPSPGSRPPGPPRPGDPVPMMMPATKTPSMKTSTNSNYLFSGEHYEEVVDLSVPGRGLDFTWARKYRSRLGPTTALGNGWDYSYNIYLTQAGLDLVVHDGDTRADLYSWNGSDRWTCAEFFRELRQNPDLTYTLLFPDTGRWHFLPFDATPVQGKLMSIVDRNGNAMQFLYAGGGQLNMVVDSLGRPYVISYNPSGLIGSVTDFSGRQVQYAYYEAAEAGGSWGDLKSVTTPAVTGTPNGNDFPLGKTTTYTYTKDFADPNLNHDLLTVRDPKGQVYLQNVYAHTIGPGDPRYTQNPVDLHYDHIVRQIWGGPGDTVDIYCVAQVPQPTNNFAVVKAIVNDRVGNVKEFFYDQRNRLVIAREYTGRAPNPDAVTTEVVNRPTGKLRADDPGYFDTWYEYNGDSLVTRTIYPNGNEETYTYDALNPERRSQGNLLTHCNLPGPLGGDQPSVCESFEYQSGFGGCCGDFVNRHVDFRGNETLQDYDGNGNRIHTTHRLPAAVEDWEYNIYGQTTAHTWPDNGSGHRRRDENSYYDVGPQTGYLYQSIIDAGGFGLTVTCEYDPVGNVVRLVDARGNDTLYDVNQLNQVVRDRSREVTPGSGVRYDRLYYHDANDNLVRVDVQNVNEADVIQPNAYCTTLYGYDVLNYLLSSQHEVEETRAIVTAYVYDANRNCTLMRFGEATNGHDPYNVIQMQYDERDLPFREVRAPGSPGQSTTQFDYDGNTNSRRTSQGLEDEARIIEFAHDGYNRLRSQTDAMGNVTSQHYDENGNRVSLRTDGELVDVPGNAGNVRLFEEVFDYDEMDRLTVEDTAFFDPATQLPISDGSATTVTDWSPNSQVLSVTNDNGHMTLTTYDTANRRDTTTDAKGNQIVVFHDENSNEIMVAEIEVSGSGGSDAVYYTNFTYDGLDRRIRTENNLGTTTESGYDSHDNLTVVTDGAGSKSRYSYDDCARHYNTTYDMDGDGPDGDGEDIVLLQTWDDSSRLIEESDENGNVTQYSYDPLNRLIRKEYADGNAETAEYDVHDNTKKKWDTNGSNVQSFFDVCNRPTDRTITPAPGVSDDTTFEVLQYDGLSRMVFAADDDSTVTRSHDSLSDITEDAINGRAVTAAYDGVGNLLDCTYPGGREVTSTYDSLERVRTITDLAGLVAEYQYVGPNRIERVDLGNGGRADYTYDGTPPNPPGDFGVKQIVGKRHTRIADGSDIDDRAFAWNRTNSKTSRRDLRAGGPGLTHQYGYDPGNRLRQTVVTTPAGDVIRQTGYQLDGVGNRTFVTNPPQVDAYFMDATAPVPADYPMNQYTGTPFDYRQYNANGNIVTVSDCLRGDANGDFRVDTTDVAPLVAALLAGGPTSCEVDLNRDDRADGLDVQPFIDLLLGGPTRVPEIMITYDYRNHMVDYFSTQKGLRHLYSYDPLGRRIGKVTDLYGSSVETRYCYLGEQVVEEQDALGGTQATYVYGPGIDEVLTMNRGGVDYYYHSDDLNSVMAVTDAAGAVVERYEYGDYGEPEFMDGGGVSIPESLVGNTRLFTGREYDPETGLYYYRTRHLDPAAGRFTSRDTIGIWGDAANLGNGYTYVGNNPATHTDPTGEQPPPSPIPVPVPIPTPAPAPPAPQAPSPIPVPPPAPPAYVPPTPQPNPNTNRYVPIPNPLPAIPVPPRRPKDGGGGDRGTAMPYSRQGSGRISGTGGPLRCGHIGFVVNSAAGGGYVIDIRASSGALPAWSSSVLFTRVRVSISGVGTLSLSNTGHRGSFSRLNVPLPTFRLPFSVDVSYQDPNGWARIGPCRIQ